MTAPGGSAWYAVIDTAQDPGLYPLVAACRDAQCLVAGTVSPILAATLPYLVRLHPGEPLLDHWRVEGAGRGWGVMVQTALSRDALRLHLKKFLNARLPGGAVVWFRFFDPAVLRTLFHASTPAELAPWFRGIDQFVVEGERPDRLHQIGFDGAALVETDFAQGEA